MDGGTTESARDPGSLIDDVRLRWSSSSRTDGWIEDPGPTDRWMNGGGTPQDEEEKERRREEGEEHKQEKQKWKHVKASDRGTEKEEDGRKK